MVIMAGIMAGGGIQAVVVATIDNFLSNLRHSEKRMLFY